MTLGFIKVDRIKHIDPRIYGYTQDLVETWQIEIKKAQSENNVAHMLTKALLPHMHKKLVHEAGMRSLEELTVL